MKAKKEILHDCLESKKDSGAKYERTSVEDAVLEAMDEWGKQQAIAFARFVNFKYESHGDNYISKNLADNVVYFSHELYAQFIEHQNKNNP